MIERVTKEDSGTYACVAENRVGTIRSLGFVSVLGEESQPFDGSRAIRTLECLCLSAEPPTVDGDLHSSWVQPLGGTAILNCEARGDPTPTVRWNRNGIRINAGNRVRQLSNGSLAIYGTVVRGSARGSWKVLSLAPWWSSVLLLNSHRAKTQAATRALQPTTQEWCNGASLSCYRVRILGSAPQEKHFNVAGKEKASGMEGVGGAESR